MAAAFVNESARDPVATFRCNSETGRMASARPGRAASSLPSLRVHTRASLNVVLVAIRHGIIKRSCTDGGEKECEE